MIKSWIFYIFWLITVFLLNVFSASYAFLIILCISIILPVIIIIVNRFIRYDLEIFINLPDSVEKNKPAAGVITVKNKTKFFCPLVKITLSGGNNVTGENQVLERYCSLLPLGQANMDFKLKDSYCGKISFKAKQVKVYDISALTYKKYNADVKGSVIVLPEILPVEFTISDILDENINSIDYSSDKPGFDLSEPYEHREYIAGDSPRSIHWKLSQKLNKLIIRQGGMPSPTSALLILDTCLSYSNDMPSFSRLSKTVEIFISLSKKMCDCHTAHTLCFYDHSYNEIFEYSIASDSDWFSVIPKILSASFKTDSKTSLDRCCENRTLQFNNIFFISPCSNISSDLENINLTVLTADDFSNNI